jgi:hypothetical protein
MRKYYVYLWINPKTQEVFYVGKGKYTKYYNRAFNKHHAGRCENKRAKLIQEGYKNEDIVHLVADSLSEEQSLRLEAQLIEKYGILEEGGTLFNFRKNGTESGSYQKYREQDILKMIEVYRGGSTLKQIGEMYNIHECTVRKYLRTMNIKLRQQGYTVPRPENWSEILKDVNIGFSLSKISKKYGICYPTLKRLLSENPN